MKRHFQHLWLAPSMFIGSFLFYAMTGGMENLPHQDFSYTFRLVRGIALSIFVSVLAVPMVPLMWRILGVPLEKPPSIVQKITLAVGSCFMFALFALLVKRLLKSQ